jgi:hypothetical protein
MCMYTFTCIVTVCYLYTYVFEEKINVSWKRYSADSPSDVSPNDISPNNVSPNDVSPNNISPNDRG